MQNSFLFGIFLAKQEKMCYNIYLVRILPKGSL